MNRELIFEGSHRQIGLLHGQALRDEIATVLSTYIGMWGISKEKIPVAVNGFKKRISEDYPHLAEEINGIAKGSGMGEDYIYAINARTELLEGFAGECTSVGVPASSHEEGHVLLAQNWDWYAPFRNLAKVVEVRPDRKARMKMLIEPGMVGKIGMNESGLGVCVNFLPTERVDKKGVPVHVILRNIMECEDYFSAREYVSTVRKAASMNYLIGHKDGNIAGFETTPEGVMVMYPNPLVSHTNSYTARGESCLRKKIFDFIISRAIAGDLHDKISTDEVNRALGLVRLPKASRLEQYFFESYGKIFNFYGRSETIGKINLDLTEGSLSVSSGAKSDSFAVHRLH